MKENMCRAGLYSVRNVFRICRFLPLCREEDKENLGLRVAARSDVLTNCQPTVANDKCTEAHGLQCRENGVLWLSPATVPRTETERGEKGGKKAEKVAEFCEKAGNNCAKVPMFSRICSQSRARSCGCACNQWTTAVKLPVVRLRTKKNLPLCCAERSERRG